MKQSSSVFVDIRGLRYHVRQWGNPRSPKLFFLHGWRDNSASFQFLVDALKEDWLVIAPDWRGCGLTDWSQGNGYWFSDFLADLDELVDHFSEGTPASLVAHSMGFNIASVYAGVRPERVAKLVNIDCYGFRTTAKEEVAQRYAAWLEASRAARKVRAYSSYEEVEAQLRRGDPTLTPKQASFLARAVARETEDGKLLQNGDPALRDPANLMIYIGFLRPDDAAACWKNVTADVLWIQGAASDVGARIGVTAQELKERKASFRSLKEAILPELSHRAHVQDAENIAALIEDFLPVSEPREAIAATS